MKHRSDAIPYSSIYIFSILVLVFIHIIQSCQHASIHSGQNLITILDTFFLLASVPINRKLEIALKYLSLFFGLPYFYNSLAVISYP